MATVRDNPKAEAEKKKLLDVLDVNGDGKLGIEDIILGTLKIPGVYINREKFLRKELEKYCDPAVIERAVLKNPTKAGVPQKVLDRIADAAIDRERLQASGIAVALGMPGGWAMAATIPADILQYYMYTLRAIQELLYVYGFPEIDVDDAEGLQVDNETLNMIILCMAAMNGVAGANNAIKAIAKALGTGVEKQLLKKALTKGLVYPVVKKVMAWFGVRLNKQIFAGFFKKAIPVVGGAIGGGLTFFSFKPCCLKLKDTLQDTILTNPNHKSSEEEDEIYNGIVNGDIVDAEYEDITEEEPVFYDPMDLNHDGVVDEKDMEIFRERLGLNNMDNR